jgi:hypothetical protein
MSLQHTPTPWSVCSAPANDLWYVGISIEASGARVADTCILNNHHTEDAAFIVLACNAHDELVAALKFCVIEIAGIRNRKLTRGEEVALDAARAALAKAGAV